jgi:hypothetical protein
MGAGLVSDESISKQFNGLPWCGLNPNNPFKIFCVLCASVFQSFFSPFSALDKNVANHMTVHIGQPPLRPVVVVG